MDVKKLDSSIETSYKIQNLKRKQLSSDDNQVLKQPRSDDSQLANTFSNHDKKNKIEKFRYGNFDRYYGTRLSGNSRDPRLDVFKKEWFVGKNVLDIGCNAGYLTLSLAKEFEPTRILGIDIDDHLIGVARKNIRHYCDGDVELIGKLPAIVVKNQGTNEPTTSSGFPTNVWFRKENYVLDNDDFLEMAKPEYDVILALSISKWIHLNWGDVGIKRFFKRVYSQLRPNGLFIIETQPFSSYRKRSKINDELRENYRQIKFRPEQFKDYLLSSEVGFISREEIDTPKALTKVRLKYLDHHLATRLNIAITLSLVHYQFSAYRFIPLIQYAWYAAGYNTEQPPSFRTPANYCFDFYPSTLCSLANCGKLGFMRCAGVKMSSALSTV